MCDLTPKQLCNHKLYNGLNKNNLPAENKTVIVPDHLDRKKIIQVTDMCLEDYLKSLNKKNYEQERICFKSNSSLLS